MDRAGLLAVDLDDLVLGLGRFASDAVHRVVFGLVDVAAGLQPFPEGFTWLRDRGYRTVVNLRAAGEDDTAARTNAESKGLKYISLEIAPKTLNRDLVAEFSKIVAESANQPVFVYDRKGHLQGAMWFLHFRLADNLAEPEARRKAVRLGLKEEMTGEYGDLWLAINQINQDRGFATQLPYVQPDGVPLSPHALLHRPLTDPFFVDTTAYTDYYRVRASLFNRSAAPWNLREYNVPNAHSSGASLPLFTSPARVGCPAGATIPAVNPLDGRPYTRAFILSLARRTGVHGLRVDAPWPPPSRRSSGTRPTS